LGVLVALSASHMASSKRLTLVRADSPTPEADETLPLITLAKTELLVGTEHVASLTPGPLGFDAALKRSGQQAALQLLPLGTALGPIHDADPSQHTVRVLVDASTAYRPALEVFFSAAQAGFTSFDLIVAGDSGERFLSASTPSRAERESARAPGAAPAASFVLQAGGVSITVGDTPVGAGCTVGGQGFSVPAVTRGKLDDAGVGACASRLASLNPAWGDVHVANVSANPGLDMQSVLGVVAAILPALPTVHFGLLSG
jgi:hypothetical protein